MKVEIFQIHSYRVKMESVRFFWMSADVSVKTVEVSKIKKAKQSHYMLWWHLRGEEV
jgi:hypothetical protein